MYSSLTDVADDLMRPLTEPEQAKASQLLEYAAAHLKRRVPRLDEHIADGTLDPILVASVSNAMVVRVMRNPDGRRQGSVSIDDASKSWTVDSALSTGALYVSDTELATLMPLPSSFGIGTIRLGHAL